LGGPLMGDKGVGTLSCATRAATATASPPPPHAGMWGACVVCVRMAVPTSPQPFALPLRIQNSRVSLEGAVLDPDAGSGELVVAQLHPHLPRAAKPQCGAAKPQRRGQARGRVGGRGWARWQDVVPAQHSGLPLPLSPHTSAHGPPRPRKQVERPMSKDAAAWPIARKGKGAHVHLRSEQWARDRLNARLHGWQGPNRARAHLRS
jgi:hypothetical protein